MPERYWDFPVNMTQPNPTTIIVDPQKQKLWQLLFFKCVLRYLVRRYQLFGGSRCPRLQGKKVSPSVEYFTSQKELKTMCEPMREKGGFVSGKAWQRLIERIVDVVEKHDLHLCCCNLFKILKDFLDFLFHWLANIIFCIKWKKTE